MDVLIEKQLWSLEDNSATHVQILKEVVGISHSANTFGKGMNTTIFPSAMGK